jgi:uncharacterized membrane protein
MRFASPASMTSTNPVPEHVNENIESVAQLQKVFGARVTPHERTIEAITARIGSPGVLVTLVSFIVLWTGYNGLAFARHGVMFDHPPFFWLQGMLSVYAAIVTTIVLTTQNRQNRESEQRAHIELQVSLLAEQKATKVIALLEELRRDLPNVTNRSDPEAQAMQQRADPKDVLAALESTMESPATGEPGPSPEPKT